MGVTAEHVAGTLAGFSLRPRASFQLSVLGDEAFRECWALSNLQPLWASENIRKGCKHG